MGRLASFSAARLPVLGHLHQLVDGVQQAVAVLLQQLLVEPLVSEAHLQEHGHHGRVLLGAGLDASLQSRNAAKHLLIYLVSGVQWLISELLLEDWRCISS